MVTHRAATSLQLSEQKNKLNILDADDAHHAWRKDIGCELIKRPVIAIPPKAKKNQSTVSYFRCGDGEAKSIKFKK